MKARKALLLMIRMAVILSQIEIYGIALTLVHASALATERSNSVAGAMSRLRPRMRLEPVAQGGVHPCLPAFAGCLEGLDDVSVVADRQGQFGGFRLGPATGKSPTEHDSAFLCR